jgi:hypothetical protein
MDGLGTQARQARRVQPLLARRSDTSFVVRTANDACCKSIRYVITLDSDTQLPRDVARKLVGAAIHPLNQPQIDAATNRVTAATAFCNRASASRSQRFAFEVCSDLLRLHRHRSLHDRGLDVYQDFFGEGNFTGKGLYDVDAFNARSRTACRRIAAQSRSFESLFARAALTTDIELLDDYPASYEATRNDRIAGRAATGRSFAGCFRQCRTAKRKRSATRLPLIARWKILDNLRRSLVAPALFLWLVASCALFPGSALLWSLFVFLVIAFPVYLHVTTGC